MKKHLNKILVFISVIVAFAFINANKFTDFEARNFNGINVSTSIIQDKIIIIHTILSQSKSYNDEISVYKELQDVYVKAFFDKYAKKGLVVITLTDKVVNESILPNKDYTFLIKEKKIKELLKQYQLNKNGGNLIINGKREIVYTNVPINELKLKVGSLLTRDRLEINYFE